MKFYRYRQNNSFGRFEGPAEVVYIQAPSAHAADAIAEEHGVYFDGVWLGVDCGCCGDRWKRAGSDDELDESDVPRWPSRRGSIRVVYNNGQVAQLDRE